MGMEYVEVQTTTLCPGCQKPLNQLVGILRDMDGKVIDSQVPGKQTCPNGCHVINDMDGNVVSAIPRRG